MTPAEVLGPSGLLARELDGFNHRPYQLEMAQAVTDVLEQEGVLIAEAGTGTGKTYAYLVPVLLSGKKVIVSTGTRNLQDQLFHRDLPRVRAALGRPVQVALLKGRANYLCRHRLGRAWEEDRQYVPATLKQLRQVRDWSTTTSHGDIAELEGVPESAPVWPLVTSSADNCLGTECTHWDDCHLVEARRRAQEADVVVINHHLLCADFALREEGFGELLPAADAFVIDEAHQLPSIASDFFGTSLTTRQLQELSADVRQEYVREAGDLPDLLPALDRLVGYAQDLRLSFGTETRRGSWSDISDDPRVPEVLAEVDAALTEVHKLLKVIEGRGKGLDHCLERATGLLGMLAAIRNEADADEVIRWYETYQHSVRLNRTPLDIAPVFRDRMQHHARSWIFTSATLAVGDSFSHFQQQLGLEQARTARWDSPFDYPQQALWFVPRGLPEPSAAGYTVAVAALALELIECSEGRAFLLFTSHRALEAAAEWLQSRTDYPLLVQGTAPKAALLEQFVAAGNAVLLGTASFWEGVDVRGGALSLVLIDKLPFAAPGDPVLKARLDALRRNGSNPFMAYQVPQAVIALKQGAGRLIRDTSDTGVLVTCDPRLLRRDKPYGRIFIDALPPFARTRDIDDVSRFFAKESDSQ